MRICLIATVLVLCGAVGTPAQQPAQPAPTQKPPTQTTPAPSGKPAARTSQAGRGAVTFFITGPEGTAVREAVVQMTGPATREGTTNKDGVLRLQGLRAGNYRVRVEAPEFITLERDIAMRNGLEVEITLNPAREPAEPPAPQAPSAPPQPTPMTLAPDPSATVELSSVVEFFSKNKLGRNEPQRESVQAESGAARSSLLQVRNTIDGRSHAAADEVLYVINGEAAINSKGRTYQLETGSLVLIPRGVTYSISNRGREPLWALSVLAGQGGQ